MHAKLMVGLTFIAVYVTLILRRVKSLYWNHDSIRISHTFKSDCVPDECTCYVWRQMGSRQYNATLCLTRDHFCVYQWPCKGVNGLTNCNRSVRQFRGSSDNGGKEVRLIIWDRLFIKYAYCSTIGFVCAIQHC